MESDNFYNSVMTNSSELVIKLICELLEWTEDCTFTIYEIAKLYKFTF